MAVAGGCRVATAVRRVVHCAVVARAGTVGVVAGLVGTAAAVVDRVEIAVVVAGRAATADATVDHVAAADAAARE